MEGYTGTKSRTGSIRGEVWEKRCEVRPAFSLTEYRIQTATLTEYRVQTATLTEYRIQTDTLTEYRVQSTDCYADRVQNTEYRLIRCWNNDERQTTNDKRYSLFINH